MHNTRRVGNSLYEQSNISRTALIFAPHEDDESILACNLIEAFVQSGTRVYIAYLTNGDYKTIPELRYAEAIKAVKRYGLNPGDVFFLGYPDTQFDDPSGRTSVLESEEIPFSSVGGHSKTYGVNGIDEYCYHTYGVHHEYTSNNIMADTLSVVERLLPDVIVSVDYDNHPDHMTLSFCLDDAIEKVIKKNTDYRPVLYKSFAYCLGYFADDDYYASNLLPTIPPDNENVPEGFNLINKSIFDWDERIRIPLAPGNAEGRFIFQKLLFKVLACHRSQFAAFRATRILNSDEVFWSRRTDSLLYDADVYLNDIPMPSITRFFLFRANQFHSRDMSLEDEAIDLTANDCLRIQFHCAQALNSLYICGDINAEATSANLRFEFSNGFIGDFCYTSRYGSTYKAVFPEQSGVEWIKIRSNENTCSISRVAAFEEGRLFSGIKPFIKIMIDNNYVYNYLAEPDTTRIKLQTYRFGTDAAVSYEVVAGNATVKDSMLSVMSNREPIILRASCDNGTIYDQIAIRFGNDRFAPFRRAIDSAFLKCFRLTSHASVIVAVWMYRGSKAAMDYILKKFRM